MELSPDTLLNNRYRIMSKLGQGGMGAVYLAVDTALDAQVAVKVNRNPAAESTTQFLHEARLLAALRHPNLPRVTDYFILDGAQFLVMDYIAGKDLDTLLKEQGALPLALVLDWGRQLGNALSYLHQQTPPVIHRDVKPANVRLSSEGSVILVDFGIAKVVDANQATATGAVGYTPGYAPPEQYGGNLRTGPNTDQYSFAALLYHLLTGQKPADSVQRALGQSNLVSLRLARPDVPPLVESALEKALSLKPDDRFASMDDLLRALNTPVGAASSEAASRAAASSAAASPARAPQADVGSTSATQISASDPAVPVTPPHQAETTQTTPENNGPTARLSKPSEAAAPTPPAGSAPTPARRRPNGLLLAGLGLLVVTVIFLGIVLVGGGGLLVWRSLARPTDVLPVAVILSETPHPAGLTLPEISNTPSPQVSSTLAATDTPAPPPATATQTATLTQPPSDTPLPSLTPIPLGKGGLVVFASDRGDGQTLQLWSMRLTLTDSGQVIASDTRQLTNSPGDKRSPVWSPDGQRLLYVAPGGEGLGLDLWLINADGSGEAINLTQRKGDDTEPAWSPDGNWIAFTNNGREDKVRMLYLMHPDGSDLKRLSTEQEEFDATWSPDMKWLGFVMNVGGVRIMFMRDRLAPIATPVHDYFVTPQRFDMQEVLGNLGQVSEPAWSPDGSWVAYTRQDGKHQRIYLARYPVQLPSQDILQMTDGTADTAPNWSPDSQWILFSAEREGNAEIFIMRATGQLQTNLTLSPSRDLDAAWQPIP